MKKYERVYKVNNTTYVERHIATAAITPETIAIFTDIDNNTNLQFAKKIDNVITFFAQKKTDFDNYFIELCEISKFNIEEYDDATLIQTKKDILFEINSVIKYMEALKNKHASFHPDSFEKVYKRFIVKKIIRQVFFRKLVGKQISISKGGFSILENEHIVLINDKEYLEEVDSDDSIFYINIDNCITDDFGNIFIPDSAKEKGKYAARFRPKLYAGG